MTGSGEPYFRMGPDYLNEFFFRFGLKEIFHQATFIPRPIEKPVIGGCLQQVEDRKRLWSPIPFVPDQNKNPRILLQGFCVWGNYQKNWLSYLYHLDADKTEWVAWNCLKSEIFLIRLKSIIFYGPEEA